MRETVFEYAGIKFRAMDDEICALLSDAAWFEKIGSASLQTAIRIAFECQRIVLA